MPGHHSLLYSEVTTMNGENEKFNKEWAKDDAIREEDNMLILVLDYIGRREDDRYDRLNRWERRFLNNMVLNPPVTMSPKQREKIKGILRKVRNDPLLEAQLDAEDNMRARGFPE